MTYSAVRPEPPHNSRCSYQAGVCPGFVLGFSVFALLLGFSGLGFAAPDRGSANKPAAAVKLSKPYIGWARGRLLISPRAGLPAVEFDQALRKQQGRSKRYIKQLNTHIIELPAGADEVSAMKALRKDRRFKHVELDMAVDQAAYVSDPSFGSSWALSKIQAPIAWDIANGAGVMIAVLDTGVDSAHPDLAPNLVPGWNVYDNNADTSDVNGHGTAVAGAAAMAANNGSGSAGVAWGARIMPVRIAGPDGYAYWSTVAQGIYWAADRGAKVVNVSYNGVSASATVQAAAQYLRSKGGVVVVAAGNSGGEELVDPSDALLTVSATDSSDLRAGFSSYGGYVDLAAPGVGIYSPVSGGGYGNWSGTSFSSPIVAGTAALMLSANNRITPADIDRILKETAVDLGQSGNDIYFGAGRVNAAAAVSAARNTIVTDTQAPVASILSPAGGRVSGLVMVDVNATDNVGVSRVDFFVNGQLVASEALAPFSFAWDTSGKIDGSYSLSVTAYDAAGNRGNSPTVSVMVGNDTSYPTISSTNLTDDMKLSGRRQAISISASDNQSVSKISLSLDGKEIAISYGTTLNHTLNTRGIASGSHVMTVRITDNSGNVTSRSYTVLK